MVQGVVRSGDSRWQAFCSQGPVVGSVGPGVIFRSWSSLKFTERKLCVSSMKSDDCSACETTISSMGHGF
jgi:hypothetical protein